MIWTHSIDDLHAFSSYLNSIHPTIKFTSNYSFTSIPFLDVNVSVNNGNITTDLYTKTTDKHQYLLHSSRHPQHTKRAFPFSLALRLRRICSSDETFKQRSNELKSYLNKRGCNLSFLNQEVARVQNITRTQALTPKDTTSTTNQPQRVPLVITYNPALRYVSSIINKHFNILSFCHFCLPVALTFSKLNSSLPSDGLITLVICQTLYTLFFKIRTSKNLAQARCSYFFGHFSLKMFLFCS